MIQRKLIEEMKKVDKRMILMKYILLIYFHHTFIKKKGKIDLLIQEIIKIAVHRFLILRYIKIL